MQHAAFACHRWLENYNIGRKKYWGLCPEGIRVALQKLSKGVIILGVIWCVDNWILKGCPQRQERQWLAKGHEWRFNLLCLHGLYWLNRLAKWKWVVVFYLERLVAADFQVLRAWHASRNATEGIWNTCRYIDDMKHWNPQKSLFTYLQSRTRCIYSMRCPKCIYSMRCPKLKGFAWSDLHIIEAIPGNSM